MAFRKLQGLIEKPQVPLIDSNDPINRGLNGAWAFSEGAGSNAFDWSGRKTTGALTAFAPAMWTPKGRTGSSLVLNGSTQYVNLGTSTLLNTGAFSLSIWVNLNSLSPAYSAVVSRIAPAGPTIYYQLFVKSSGKIAVYIANGSVVNYDGSGVTTLVTNRWYHLAVTYDSVNGTKGYVNGVLDGTAGNVGALGLQGASLLVGHDVITAGRLVNGTVDNFRYYNRTLSQTEVRRLYQEPMAGMVKAWDHRTLPRILAPGEITGVRGVAQVGALTTLSASGLTTRRNIDRLQQNAAAYDDPTVDDDQVRRSLYAFRQRQRMTWLFPFSAVGVSKFVQYDVLAPPDASVDVSKFVQYDVLAPPDTSVDVSKFVQYVVLETNPSIIRTPMLEINRRIISPWAQYDADEADVINERRIMFRAKAIAAAAINASITGVGGVAGIGILGKAETVTLSGVAGTSGIGTLTVTGQATITGVAGLAQTGTVTVETSKSVDVTGVQGTAQIGQPLITTTGNIAIFGVAGIAHVGSVGTQSTFNPLTGVQGTAHAGQVLTISTGNITNVTVSGVAATARTGSVTATVSPNVQGVLATAHAGTLAVLHYQPGFSMSELDVVTVPTSSTDQNVSLRWSDDAGQSYSNAVMQSMGDTGQFDINLQWRRLGTARERVFSLEWSSAQQTALTGVFLTYTVAGT